MARRRRFYARDTHGRFARVNGSRGVYKRRMSTRKKIAIAGAGAVAVGVAAYGGRELYRAGARKGWEIGKVQGVKQGKPLRGNRGRFLSDSAKRDYSQNPFARGYRPVGKEGRARKVPKLRTVGDRYRQWERRAEGVSPNPGRRATKAARNAGRMSARVRATKLARSNARRFNDAQTRSQVANNAGRAARNASAAAGTVGSQVLKQSRAGMRNARTNARSAGNRARTNARINSTIVGHNVRSHPASRAASQRVTNARINAAVLGANAGQKVSAVKTRRQKASVRKLKRKR